MNFLNIGDFIFIKESLFIKSLNVLIVSDIHIGYEESLMKSGFLIPRIQFKETINRFNEIFDIINSLKLDINKIIITGDLKHEFATISKQEWNEVFKLIEFLKEKSEVILIKGNHDTITKPFINENLKQYNFLILNDYLFVHGDKLYDNEIKRQYNDFNFNKINIIQGHMHPAIVLKDNINRLTFKSFILGNLKKKFIDQRKRNNSYKFVIMPAFNPLTQGFNIKEQSVFSPFLRYYDLDSATAITSEEMLMFPLNKI